MKKQKIQSRVTRCLICVAVLAASLFAAQDLGSAQDNTNNSPKTEQQRLAEAQTRYYEAQAAKLDQEHSTSQRIFDLVASLGASAAVIILILNFSSTVRAQREAQFLEALKRFGDEDSPTMRASAAGLLAKLSNQKGMIFWNRRPNFDIALDQLMTGLLLEDNEVCLTSIKDALRELTTYAPLKTLEKMRTVNFAVQKDMAEALAVFLATKPPVQSTELPADEHWIDAAASTPYEAEILWTLVGFFYNEEDFRKAYKTALHEYGAMEPALKSEQAKASRKALGEAGERLRLNVEIYCIMLKTDPFRDIHRDLIRHLDIYKQITVPAMNLEKIFLAGGDLSSAQLQGVNFANAQLQAVKAWGVHLEKSRLFGTKMQGASLYSSYFQGADLGGADLRPLKVNTNNGTIQRAADLQQAHLEGANLTNASLQGLDLSGAYFDKESKLHGVVIDDSTKFKLSNWWLANFKGEGFNHGISEKVQSKLFSEYGDEVPEDINELHVSVEEFLRTNPRLGKS